jgi:hypothetical protein
MKRETIAIHGGFDCDPTGAVEKLVFEAIAGRIDQVGPGRAYLTSVPILR